MSLQHTILLSTATLENKVNLMLSFITLSIGLWCCHPHFYYAMSFWCGSSNPFSLETMFEASWPHSVVEDSRRACLSQLDHEVPSLRTIPLAWFQASRFSDKAQSSPCMLRTCGPYPTPGRVDAIVLLSCRLSHSSIKETVPSERTDLLSVAPTRLVSPDPPLRLRHGKGTLWNSWGCPPFCLSERITNIPPSVCSNTSLSVRCPSICTLSSAPSDTIVVPTWFSSASTLLQLHQIRNCLNLKPRNHNSAKQ